MVGACVLLADACWDGRQGRGPKSLCALLVTRESASDPARAGAGPPPNHPAAHLTATLSESDVPVLDRGPYRRMCVVPWVSPVNSLPEGLVGVYCQDISPFSHHTPQYNMESLLVIWSKSHFFKIFIKKIGNRRTSVRTGWWAFM